MSLRTRLLDRLLIGLGDRRAAARPARLLGSSGPRQVERLAGAIAGMHPRTVDPLGKRRRWTWSSRLLR